MAHLPVLPVDENINGPGYSVLTTAAHNRDTCPGYRNPGERYSYSLITGWRATVLVPPTGGIVP